ncbi:MAG TPA: MFS transporter [Candidatus Dormibacteraeota bacterium]|jgi:MFS family permease|nr:MFS transporter [Candidatus Dormibacteraeota bacterium]
MPKKIGLRMILYLYMAVFLTRIGFGSITILFPLYLPAGAFQVGLILALYPIAEAISAMPVGRLADRMSRKRLHLAGMGTITILTAAIGFTRNLLDISVLHAFMGVSAAMAAVTSLTLLGDATKQTNRGGKMGGFDLANLGGYGVGFGVGSVLVTEFTKPSWTSGNYPYGLSYAFWATSSIFLVTSMLATKFLMDPVKSIELNQPKARHRRIGSKLRPVLPVWLGQTIVLGMYFLLPKAFQQTSFAVTRDMLIFLGVIGVLFALGAIIFGRISDKVGRTKIMIMGAVGELGFLVLFGWSFPDFLRFQLILAPLFFMASAIAPAILSYISDVSGRARRGSANGIYSVVLSIGMAAGNILGGFFLSLPEFGVQWIFFAGAGIMGPSILLTSGLLRRA